MNFLGCDGMWQLQSDGTAICSGNLQTFTVQEMQSSLTPAITWDQRYEITGSLLAFFVFVWVCRTVRTST